MGNQISSFEQDYDRKLSINMVVTMSDIAHKLPPTKGLSATAFPTPAARYILH